MARQIAIGIIFSGDDQVVVGRRAADTVLAGYDEFPGGKVESDESPEQAVVRECREETGLQVVVVSLIETIFHSYDHGDVELWFFKCQPQAGQEVELKLPFTWLAIEDLKRCRFPEANVSIVQGLMRDC